MGKLRWYKRDPDAALNGMMELTLEERGAYNTVLDLIYSRDGNLPDDDRFIAGWLRCDLRVWKRIKSTLVDAGKLYVEEGTLRNHRADVEILRGLDRCLSVRQINVIKGIKSGEVRRKNKELAEPEHEPKTNRIKNIEDRKKEEPPNPIVPSPPPVAPDGAAAPANAVAVRVSSVDFDRFWSEVPRRVGKDAAHRKFVAVIKAGQVTADELIAGMRRYADHVRSSAIEQQFVVHASTWLNQGRWLDDLSTDVRNGNGQGKSGTYVSPQAELLTEWLRGMAEDTDAVDGSTTRRNTRNAGCEIVPLRLSPGTRC